MILVDTSAWIRHFKSKDERLDLLLRENRVFTCDVVIGELALGSGLPKDVGNQIARLPQLASPTSSETLSFLERHQRTFRTAGVGWADTEIIVSAVTAGALLYTHDRPQRSVWRRLGFRLA